MHLHTQTDSGCPVPGEYEKVTLRRSQSFWSGLGDFRPAGEEHHIQSLQPPPCRESLIVERPRLTRKARCSLILMMNPRRVVSMLCSVHRSAMLVCYASACALSFHGT